MTKYATKQAARYAKHAYQPEPPRWRPLLRYQRARWAGWTVYEALRWAVWPRSWYGDNS